MASDDRGRDPPMFRPPIKTTYDNVGTRPQPNDLGTQSRSLFRRSPQCSSSHDSNRTFSVNQVKRLVDATFGDDKVSAAHVVSSSRRQGNWFEIYSVLDFDSPRTLRRKTGHLVLRRAVYPACWPGTKRVSLEHSSAVYPPLFCL